MPNVQMPNGVVVAFPDDMPREQISALIASKFPTEARNAMSDNGKKPYQGVLEGSATAIGNIPALLAKTKAGIGQAAAESAHQLFDPTFDENIRTPPLEEIVKPGAPVAEMLTAPAARMMPSWNLGSVLPDDWRKAAAQVTAREALAQRLRGMKAAEEVKPLDMDPRTPGGYVAQTAGAVAEMAAPAALSLMVKNPGPLMVYFGARAGGEKYFEARQEGNTVSASQTGAALYAAAELGTEAIGGHIFVHGAGKTFLGTVLKNAATEGLTEGATEALQALVDAGVLHEDMTLDQALNRVKDATIVGAMAGGTISAVTHPLRGKADTSSPAPAVDPGSVPSTGSDGAPAAALPPPSPQLALPSPEAYAVPDAIRRQLNQNVDAAVLDQTAVPDPAEEVDAIARIALKRTKQAETAALLQTARETIAPIGTFEAAELPDDVALQVGRHRATRGRAIDTPITVDDMVRAKVPQAKIDAVIALRKPVTAGRAVTPDEIRLVAKSKNIILDSNFNELARRTVGSSKLEDMTLTQLSVLHDTVAALPEHEVPVVVPLAERPVFTDKQYADAVAATRKQGRYTAQAVKVATGLKNDADVRAVRDAMVRRGQLVQRGDKDFRLYDVLGEQEKATPAKLPEGAFREHVVRRMPIGAVTLQVNGKARGKFASEAAASEAVFRLREKEARERKPDSKPADVKIIPAGETGYGVIENRYDAQGNFLGQAVVESHRNEGPARDAADRLNNPREGAKPRPAEAAPERLPGGRFILRENGQIVDQVFNTSTELREELRRRRAENQRLGLQPPVLSVEAAPGVTEAPPVTPRPAPTNIPSGLAGRLAEVTDRLQAIAHTRGLPLLGTKVRLTPEVKLGGQTIEGVFTPSKNLIRLTTIHLKPDMSLDEVVDTLAAVMDHETIHALKEAGVLSADSKAWKTLTTYATKAIKPGTDTTYLADAHANYDGRPGYETAEDIEEEAIAEVFRYWAADRRNVAGKPATALRQIVEWFRRLISGVPTSVLKDIESGAMVRAKFPPPGSTTRTAKNQQNLSQATTAMAAAQASGSATGMQYVRRQYVRARDQSREDRFGHTGGKTVIGDVPSLAYQTGERDIDVGAQLADRVDNAGIGRKKRLRTYLPEPEAFLRQMADAQATLKHEPNREAVSRAYFTLNTELKAIVTALNLKITSFAGPGEPYASQAAMLADVARGQLKMRMSVDQFGTTPDNSDHPLYKQSGINTTDGKPLTYNDLLRVVVDVLGHGQTGLGYGPRDGYNAYHAARPFFSDMALPALATETLVQGAWQHHGKHLRRPDGTLPDSGDIDYLPLDQRQYPVQKAFVLSLAFLNTDPGVQAFEEAVNAEDLGEDARFSVNEPNVIKLADVREKKALEGFHKDLMGRVADRVGEMRAALAAAIDAGVFAGFDVGTRLRSQNSEGAPLAPMKIEGRLMREWKGSRLEMAMYERLGRQPLLVEFNGKRYVPMLTVVTGEAPPANFTDKQQDEWAAEHPGAEWSRFQTALDLVRDRKMGGLRLAEKPDERYSVGSSAFQSWFGDSKVTDAVGLPLRVFHATAAVSFDEFDTKRSEMGTHFGTYRQAHAMAYELSKDKPRIFKTGIGTHMYPIYLSIKRPLRLRDESSFGNDYVAPQLAELGLIDDSYANLLKGYGYQNRLALQNAIKAAGYDGVVYLNRVEGVFDKSAVSAQSSEQFDRDVRELTDEAFKEKYPTAEDSWIVFEPTQAKSAIGNLGTYDPNNPDMRYSVSSPQFDDYLARAYAELTPKDLTPLPNIEHGLTGPIPVAVLAARDYAKAAGLPVRRQAEYVKVDVERARRIANAYAAMPHAPDDPAVQAAYKAMAEETIAQYKAVKATGLKIETILPGMDDPYPAGPRDVLRDIARGHIWYFPTEDGFGSNDAFDPSANPLLAPTDEVSDNGKPMVVNDLFRVVHDFFGHGIEGTGFGPRGEENAWQSHMRLFSERAVPAMTSETRGQNSWVNYGPYGERNRANPRETVYADQKTGVMPEWTWREGVVDDTPDDPNAPRQLRDVGAFTAAFDAARKARPEGGMVHRYADEDYADMRLFLTSDNMAGFAIKDDGDIVSVFANPAGPRGRLPVLMQAAVAAGGRKLDAFDAGLPQMYAKHGFVETGRMPWDDRYAPDGWDYAKFGRPDVVFMSYAGPEATAEDSMKYSLGTGKLLTQVPGLKGALKYLTEPERERITKRTAASFVSLFEQLPDAKEMAAVAFSGRAKRGWYNKSAEALVDIFGIEDAPRFAALLAALSPQTSVESNTINALNTWVEWDKAGRPTDRKKIMNILGRSVQGGKGLASVLDAWKNNTVRALVSEDPQSIILSGPKVNSFMLNLRRITNEVTNDAWMANYANVNQELFRAARVAAPETDPVGGQLGVKSPGYLAMSAVIRKAASIASDMTGEQWTPAEIQETVWSWAKTLYEKASSAASARDLLAAGKLSHAEIGATPDFATLFIGGVYRNILEKGGYANPVRAIESRGPAYDPSALAGEPVSPEGSGFAQGAFDTHLRRAARRLDARRAAVNANEQADIAAAYDAKFAQPEEPSPTMTEEDWSEMARFSVASPQFEAALGDRLPGGRLYGNNAASPGTLLSEPGVPAVALSAPVDGGRYFGGHLATAQLRMAQDGIDGTSMVYLRVEDFLKLAEYASDQQHPEQDKLDAAIEQGYRFNGMPSFWFEGDSGVTRVIAIDGIYAGRAVARRAERIPVVLYPKGKERFGSLVGFTAERPSYMLGEPEAGRLTPNRAAIRFRGEVFGGSRHSEAINYAVEKYADDPVALAELDNIEFKDIGGVTEGRFRNTAFDYSYFAFKKRDVFSKAPRVTIAMPNDALQEFHPERRGERMSVGSEAFRKWFGDSVVVDEQGRPLVVYHGTGRSFDAFERGRGSRGDAGQGSHIVDTGWFGSGFYFTPSGRVASHWADVRKTDEERNVMPVYLTLRNPLVVDRPDYDSGATTLGKALAKMGFFDESPSAQTAFLQSQGYDGVIANWGGKLDEIVAFEPTQIKSAIGNRGTWSAADPDIRYSLNSPLGTRVPQIDPDTYSVVHRETTSWLGRQMEKLGRSKTDIPVLGNVTRVLFGGASPYELRVAQEDQYLSLLEMMERVRKEGGRITDSQNAYIAQQAAGSKATYRIQQHQQDIYDPLLAAIKAAHKTFTLKEYEEFLYARHAPERNAFLRARGSKAPNPSGMSEAEAQAVIDRFTRSGKIDAMRALDPLLNRLRNSITQTRVDGGLLSQDNASTTYQHWVPMQNGEDFDPFDQVSRRSSFTGRGMSVAGKENRPTVGRNSKAGDLLSNMILQDTMAVVRSEHAAFNRKLVEVVASNPQLAQQDVEIMTKPPLKSVVGSDGRIRTVVDPNFRSAPGYYVTKIAGREVVLKVNNPWIERALKGEFIQQTGPILQAIGSITRVLAAMRTTYNPTFVVTNLARDLQAAALNLAPQQIDGLARRMLAGVPSSAKAVGAYMLSGDTSTEHGRYYREMLENGWTVSHMGLQTLETVVDRVRADAHMAEGWKLTAQQAKNTVRNIFGAIEGTLGVAENGVRLSAYVEARRAGASIAQAGYLAKNLTVNFNKRGERSSAMNMMYMFYNAGVQGTSVLANMAKSKRGQKILATIILTGFVLDMINRMLSGDDNDDGIPDYDQFTEYELSRNLIVPNPLAALGVPNQSRYLKFPMPLGYNAAHNLGRNISNMFARKNKTWVDSLSSIATGTVDAFNPISTGGNFLNFVAPTFADPFVDMAANTDYAGRSIVPERPNYGGPEVPQSQLYWSTTDKSYVDIAQFLNELSGGNDVRKGALDVSPEVLDYWFAFAAGGTGRFLMDMKYNITEGAPLALQGKFEDIDTTRLPLINVVVGSNVDRAAQQQYYELSKDVQTVEEEVKRFYEQGQPARAAAARKARPVEFAAAGMLSSSDRQLASLRKQIKALSENTMIRPDMKAKQLKLLRDQMDGVMTRTLRAYYQLKEAASP